MRRGILLFLAALVFPLMLPAQSIHIVPTTTLQAQTGNNTSAASNFAAQINGNLGAGNVSKVDIHSLLYAGNQTKVIAHFMPWWGDPRHINVGYSSHDPVQIHRQITDMISRGIDGVIIDWYGSKDFTDQTAKLVMAEAEQHPGFTFAIMVDKGAISLSACTGCSPQQTLIQQVQYAEQTYVPSPAYMRINGRPLITNFDIDLHYAIDWNAVQQATSTNPAFIFQHSGGFTHSVSSGSYSWVIVNVTDYGMSYLNKFYKAGLALPQAYTIGGLYKGFDDTIASWGSKRIMSQQCGQTWLQTFDKINTLYGSGTQLPAVQLVTWNDYEEGTEIETGIDNCFSLSAALTGTALQWKISGNENTIDHYIVYISSDGQNLMPLTTLASGSRSLDLSTYSLPPGNYVGYVQAVGKPTFLNHMSGAVNYHASAPPVSPPAGPVQIAASPQSLILGVGRSANTRLTLTKASGSLQNPVTFACSNLPVGVSCAFSSVSMSSGAAAATSILTISTGTVAKLSNSERIHGGNGLWISSLGMVAIAVSGSRRRLTKRLRRLLSAIALLAVLGLLASCGGYSAGSHARSRTPSGTFLITVVGAAGSQQTSTAIALTIN